MTKNDPLTSLRCHCVTILLAFTLVLGIALSSPANAQVAAQEEPKQQFDIPEGDARPMLRQFADQAKREIVFEVSDVSGITTKAVKGEYSIREALDLMLVNTGLVAELDSKTGAIAVRKSKESPNAQRLAQVATEGHPARISEDDEKVVRLSSFTVQSDKDSGYRVANSITATGIGTRIIDTPITINVMTGEFLSDTVTTDLMDKITSIAGVSGTDLHGTLPGAFQVRGYQVNPLVDGFDALQITGSAVGVDRIEVIKGPSAVFNGDVPPGGAINIISKKPSFTPDGYLEGVYGSWNYESGEVFSTGPLIKDKLAYLVDGFVKDSEGWQNWTGEKEKTIILGATYNPVDAVSISFRYQNTDHINPDADLEGTAAGFLESGLPPLTNPVTYAAQTYGPNYPPVSVIDQSLLPGGLRYNVAGPQNLAETKEIVVDSEAVIRINDHIEFREGYMYQTWFQARRYLAIAGGPLGPGGVAGFYSGAKYSAVYEWQKENKAELALHFDTGPIDHAMLVGYEYENGEFPWEQFGAGPPAVDSQGNPWNYYTDGPRMLANELNAAYPKGFPLLTLNFSLGQTYAYYVAEQMSALKDRIHVLLGVRHTEFNGGPGQDVKDWTPQVGVLIKPLPTESVFKDTAFFVNYSRSFTPSGQVDQNGTIVPPSHGIGEEVGIKTDWFAGAVSSTVSIFRDDLNNIAQANYYATQGAAFVSYTFGGAERTQGAEIDIVWTPFPNFQLDANYAWLPTATWISFPQSPAQVGLRFPVTPVHTANLNGKYVFATGLLKGAYIGGALHAQTWTHGSATLSPLQFDVYNPGLVQADAFCGYQTTLFNRKTNIRLNIKNLTDRRGFEIDNSFSPNDPISFFLTARVSL